MKNIGKKIIDLFRSSPLAHDPHNIVICVVLWIVVGLLYKQLQCIVVAVWIEVCARSIEDVAGLDW